MDAQLAHDPAWINALLTNPEVRQNVCLAEFRKYTADILDLNGARCVVADVCKKVGVATLEDETVDAMFAKFDKNHHLKLTLDEFDPFFEYLLRQILKGSAVEQTGVGPMLKRGAYVADGVGIGSLFLKKQPDKFSFMVAHRYGSTTTKWYSRLIRMGKDEEGREKFWIRGHPEGGFFIQLDEDSFEEVDANYGYRCTWKKNDDLNGVGTARDAAPPKMAKTFPSENFKLAILADASDPNDNDPMSPPLQTVLDACGCFGEGPGESKESVPWGEFFESGQLPEEEIARQKIMACLYTMETPLYREMNLALRNDDLSGMKYYSSFIISLREVFKTDGEDQIITPFEGTVYRGISFPDPDEAIKQYTQGEVFVWPSFTSMTTCKATGHSFGNVIFEVECHPPKGAYEGDVAVYAPASVQEWSFFGGGEGEILFPCNVQFKVVSLSIDEDSGTPIVCCETVAFDTDEGLADFQNIKEMLDQKKACSRNGDDTPPEDRAEKLWRNYERLFNAVDKDQSGSLSKKEMKKWFWHMKGAFQFVGVIFPGLMVPGDCPMTGGQLVNKLFAAFDTDHSGTVSYQEIVVYLCDSQGGPEEFTNVLASMSGEDWTQMDMMMGILVEAFEMGNYSKLHG